MTMIVPDLPLGIAEELLKTLGDAANIGDTVRRWRLERDLSQEELAAALRKVDKSATVKISQSTVNRIESPKPGSVQRVTLEQALTLCRFFDKPLMALLLPAEGGQILDGWVEFQRAAELLNDIRAMNNRYDDHLAKVQSIVKSNPELGNSVRQWREDAWQRILEQVRPAFEAAKGDRGVQPTLEKYARDGFTTPALIAADDVLDNAPARAMWAWRGPES